MRSSVGGGRRLPADDRREQLLEIGRNLFASGRYAEVSVNEIAEAAGVSKGLLYHYFESKDEFFLSGLRERALELLAACQTDPDRPYSEQILSGMKGYLDFVDTHSALYLNLFRDEVAARPGFAEVCDRTRQALMDRFLAGLPPGTSAPATRLALKGYFRLTETVILEWLENRAIGRPVLERLLVSALANALLSGLRMDLGAGHAMLEQVENEIGSLR
jgi:AcrR family transcriptional regulator